MAGPPPAARTQPHAEPPGELRLRRIRKTVPRIQGVWQADTFITPISIEEGERPSPPRTLLCADRESYFVLGVSVSAQSEWRADLTKKFLEWVESHGILPGELQVKRKDVYETLKPLTTPLNLKLHLEKTCVRSMQREPRCLVFFPAEEFCYAFDSSGWTTGASSILQGPPVHTSLL